MQKPIPTEIRITELIPLRQRILKNLVRHGRCRASLLIPLARVDPIARPNGLNHGVIATIQLFFSQTRAYRSISERHSNSGVD
jgi:hypothetical protein